MNSPYLNMVSTIRRSQRNGFVLGSQSDKKTPTTTGKMPLQSFAQAFLKCKVSQKTFNVKKVFNVFITLL